jgi:hypothetical protein
VSTQYSEETDLEAESLEEIPTKVITVFLLAIQIILYSFALRFFISSNSRNLLQFLQCVAVHVKEKGGKPDRKPHILPRNPYRNLKSENS